MKYSFLLLLIIWANFSFAQDTFSIVAIDTVTKEIGSAGATCLTAQTGFPGAVFISDIIAGHGAIHTQSYGLIENQLAARERMLAGDSPQQIITWLEENDYENSPELRQYGVIDLDASGSPRTAAYTGVECFDYKNHITGHNYAIQGNILLGQGILDSMEARFLRTEGTLADKLMACLQGANVPGADTRCLADGLSSKSSFLRVSRWEDPDKTYKLNLTVGRTKTGRDPIDSLQTLYNLWKTSSSVHDENFTNQIVTISNDAVSGNTIIDLSRIATRSQTVITIYDISGKEVKQFKTNEAKFIVERDTFSRGTYIINVSQDDDILYVGKAAL